jgi:hypothetical protein
MSRGAAAGGQSHAQDQDQAPLCSGAFAAAGSVSVQSTVVRLHPGCPSEAAGSPAPLPEPWRPLSLVTAGPRFNRS